MAALDDLYGPGSSEALARELQLDGWPVPEIEEIALPDGNVRVNTRWGRAEIKFECSPTHVHYLYLNSGATKPTGFYTVLESRLPDYFRDRGVEEFTAHAHNEGAKAVLRRRGDWTGAGAGLRWVL